MKRLLAAVVLLSCSNALQAALEFKPNDRVVFVGNTFAERLSQHAYFEAIVASRLPELKLSFRNLGWSADTIAGPNVRPLNFGDQKQHLAEQKTDIIFACYGMNESFAGEQARVKFEEDLMAWITEQKAANYSGKGAPRLVLVSPIAHEKLGGKLPDPTAHNEQLAAYTESMRKVAAANGCEFIDLFTPTLKLMSDSAAAGASPLTFNGIHLTGYGYWAVAQLMADALGLPSEPWRIEVTLTGSPAESQGDLVASPQISAKTLPVPPPPQNVAVHKQLQGNLPTVVVRGLTPGQYELRAGELKVAVGSDKDWANGVIITSGPAQEQLKKLLGTVDDKNLQFFHRWRAVNGEYIYGRRKEPFGVVNFPAEMQQLDQMVAEREQKIWQLSQPTGTESFQLIRVRKN